MRRYHSILRGFESHLKIAVGTVGPVSVGIDASRGSFQVYYAGLYIKLEW